MEIAETKTTFPTYPAYKDSRVEWLGEIPEEWDVLPGLSFITEGKDKNTGMKRETVLSLSYGNIRVKAKKELTGLVPESFETYQLVNKGDLIFRPTDLQNDKVSLRSSISNYEGIITRAYLNLRIKEKASSKFYHYLFRAIDNNKIIYGLGSGLRQNISFLDFRRFIFPFPPKEEQTAIANFLDDKTTKIDRAISQKEKLIALLKERKQIIIQQAVTKGLDPNVKMKDSGVEWIGEIPEGWEVVRIKHLSDKITDGEHISPIFTDIGMPFLSAKDIRDGYISFPENKFVSLRDGKKFRLRCNPEIGDLLLVSRGATIGRVSIVDSEREFCLLGSVILIKPSKKVFNKYLVSAMRNEKLQDEFLNTSHHSAQQAIYLVKVAEVHLPIPPHNEQSDIVQYLYEKGQKIDQAISLQKNQIEKLKEYKATLIDSAVTGKIKVG